MKKGKNLNIELVSKFRKKKLQFTCPFLNSLFPGTHFGISDTFYFIFRSKKSGELQQQFLSQGIMQNRTQLVVTNDVHLFSRSSLPL